MKVTLWGTRGSLASPGSDTMRYGGNTSCVEVRGGDGTLLVLDAGTGIRCLGVHLANSPGPTLRRVDILLTHLHMDHIQGLGFFEPLRTPQVEAHIWGPASTTQSLWTRLTRYLSPPLFPVHLRDLECILHLHEVPCTDVEIGEFRVSAALICHPGPTVGYRISGPTGTMAYVPDHEPALGMRYFPLRGDWVSGFDIVRGVDLLIHDAQYNSDEYDARVGWGHSSLHQAIALAELAEVRQLVPFHHDPAHSDECLDRFIADTTASLHPPCMVLPGTEGATFEV